MTNFHASDFVRTWRNDFAGHLSHNRNMARRGVPKGPVNWFLREWMDYFELKQSDMIRECGWSKASASQLYNGIQDYSPRIVNDAAKALKLETYELFLRPERAMAIRNLRAASLEIVHSTEPDAERKSA